MPARSLSSIIRRFPAKVAHGLCAVLIGSVQAGLAGPATVASDANPPITTETAQTSPSPLASPLAPPAHAAPGIGADAPDFSLPTADGGTETLAQHKGKYVVLEWTNPVCPFVLRQYATGNMQKLQAEETAKGVIWLTIDSSAKGREGYVTAEQARDWIKDKNPACSAYLLDPEGKAGHLYGARTTPHLFIISPEGKILYSGAIDSIASADPADIAKATNYVRAGLQEAMAGKAVTTPLTRPYGCSVRY